MWLLKKFAASLITLFVIIIALFIFFNYLNKTSVSEDYKELDIIGIISETTVSRSQMSGINRIQAQNINDAYFMLGFLHAKDRLFQMDINRRIIYGKLSQVLGQEYLNTDKLFRSLGFKHIINKNMKVLDNSTKSILKSYTLGINEYIKLNNKKLHIGFTVYDYKPDWWQVEDCIAIQKLFALNFSTGFKFDLILGEIAERIGISQTLELIPEAINSGPYIFQDDDSTSLKGKKKKKPTSFVNYNKTNKLLINNIINGIELISENFYMFNNLYGCNAYAVKKDDNKSEPVILSNDFHSSITLPSLWYQIQITYNNKNIAGLTIPGIPFIIIGRNDHIAWGFSNAMVDDCDYFMEKMTPDHKFYYRGDSLKSIKFIKDTIQIKNKEQHIYYLSEFDNSFLLSETKEIYENYHTLSNIYKKNYSKELAITWKWTGQKESNELGTYLKISNSKNFDEFKKSFTNFSTPFLNYIYADNKGNLALLSAGKIPVRNKSNTMVLPNPAWLEDYQWSHYGKNGIYKYIYNPTNHFVVTANNANNHELKNYYYDLPYRAARIESMIKEFLSIENYVFENFDAQRMQMDLLSNYSKDILTEIKPIFQKNWGKLTDTEKKVMKKLFYWDNLFSPNKMQPSIFNLFMQRMIINTFEDELGKSNIVKLMDYYQILYGKLLEIIKMKQSPWFDNSRTSDVETRTYIVITSFREALVEIENLYQNENPDKWLYSNFHRVNPNNFLSSSKLLKPVTDVSPSIIGGDYTTIMRTEWNWSEPFFITVAPSTRVIMDLSENSIQYSFPGGTSSEPMSPYYTNQLHLWENGGYITFDIKNLNKEDLEIFLKCY